MEAAGALVGSEPRRQRRSTHRLPRIERRSLRDIVVDAIRDAVIQGKFKPGEKIPEGELAAQLGVSRTPIREAIRILEQQGLVETRPKNGTYIAETDWPSVHDGLLLRMALEELAFDQARQRLPAAEWDALCDTLGELLEGMRRAVGKGDIVAATELDVRWHTLLVEAAANPYLARAWHNTGISFLIWSPERELYPLSPKEWSIVFESRHEELLRALRSGDPEEGRRAVRRHIERKAADVIEHAVRLDTATEEGSTSA
jgi:DNA-binding GntR family transcriptional regulator